MVETRHVLATQAGALEFLCCPPGEPLAGTRFNDGKVGPDGRLLVGTMDEQCRSRPLGSLYSVSRSGETTRLHQGFIVANGLAWSADGRRLYFSDTRRDTLYVADYCLESGAMEAPRVMAVTDPAVHGRPDGGATDVFAKLLYGFRLSVLFGLTLTLISSSIGVTVGALQGYFGGLVDLIGQRLVEIQTGMPILFVLIILASIVEPNVFWLLGILALFSWMALVGVVRAEFLRTRNFEFVRAAKALGVSETTILRRHVLPNAMVATLTYLPFILNGSITSLTALDFLGFGLPIDSPSLGRLLSSAKANLQAPWLGIFVFITLASLLTLLIFIGEAVRDALDPRRSLDLARTGGAPTDTVALQTQA